MKDDRSTQEFRIAEVLSLKLVAVLFIAIWSAGCTQRVPYPDLGTWTDSIEVLGPFQACQGGYCCPNSRCQWPMALTVPPPTETYHRALVDDAVNRYKLSAEEVVLDQVMVTLHTEAVGTVRGWAAEAIAGRNPAPTRDTASAAITDPTTAEEKLLELKRLHEKGLINDAELDSKRREVLDAL